MTDGFLLFLLFLLMLSLVMQILGGRLAARARMAQLAEEAQAEHAPEPAIVRPRPRRPEAPFTSPRGRGAPERPVPAALEWPSRPRPAVARARPPARREEDRAPSLRRAIVLMEILSPPRAVREGTTPFS